MDNTIYWIWLQLACGPASTLPKMLMSYFDNDIQKVYEAEYEEYRSFKITPKKSKSLLNKSLEEAEGILEWCTQKKVGVLCYDDPRFPERLRAIPDSPIVLYYIGELYDLDNMLCIAGVGTRSMTKYGRDTAYSFCYDLARSGVVVVSGMASGIDTTCHRAALDAGGKTVAVIGCRINKVYPAENRDIMREIARNALLITEYHPFYHTQVANFPQRNRIISGLCQGTVIFEADARSGSLITANRALTQGRKVYSLPGRIGESGSLGTNKLIQDGATLVTRAADILEEYSYLYELNYKSERIFDYSPIEVVRDSFKNKPKKKVKKAKEPAPNVEIKNDLQKQLYEMMSSDAPVSVEKMLIPGYDFGEIMSALTMLEIQGLICQKPGNTYMKKY